jgi:hypothetical protein
MDFSSVLGHIFLQSDLRFAIPSHGGDLNLSYSTQTRLHQLLQCNACTSGFGRLAGIFFGEGYLKKESVGNRLDIVVFVYVLLFPIPTVILLFSLMGFFSILKLLVLIWLLTMAVYSLTTWCNCSTVNR